MSHMLADSLDELHKMAASIGLRREWFQNHATPHYDLCQTKRKAALRLGAIEIDRRQTVTLIRRWRVTNETGRAREKADAQASES